MEPALPKMSTDSHPLLEVARVLRMSSMDSARERVFPSRNDDEVNVIGHLTIGVDRQTESRHVVLEILQIYRPILEGMEDLPAVIPPLGHVIGNVRQDNSTKASQRHTSCS